MSKNRAERTMLLAIFGAALAACDPCAYAKNTSAFLGLASTACECAHINGTCGNAGSWGLVVPHTAPVRTQTVQYYVQDAAQEGLIREEYFRAGANVHVMETTLAAESRVVTVRLREYLCGEDWEGIPTLPAGSNFTLVGTSHTARVKSAAAAILLSLIAIAVPGITLFACLCIKDKVE